MSPYPTFEVTERATLPSRTPPVETATAFPVGFAERGPVAATLCRNMQAFIDQFTGGDRPSGLNTSLYDWLDTHFREGGAPAQVGRQLGPTPVLATTNLFDAADSVVPTDVSLIVTAREHGTWANGLNVEVTVETTNFELTVTHDDDPSISETSGTLADRAAAVAWSADSAYITITLGASSEDPRAQVVSLATGDDDAASATDTELAEALDLFPSSLGPGQVAAPARTTATADTVVLAHCASNNRFALLDAPDTGTPGTITAISSALAALADDKHGALFAPWAIVPGVAAGTTRTVPASAMISGLIGRLARDGLDDGEAVAGIPKGQAAFVSDVSQTYTPAELDTLADAAVNVIVLDPNYGIVNWDNLSLGAGLDSPMSTRRLVMAIVAQGGVIAQRYIGQQIDGKGHKLSEFNGELVGMLLAFYRAGALHGDTPQEAFVVDTGSSVNTPATLEANELHAAIGLRVSPNARFVFVEIARTSIQETL